MASQTSLSKVHETEFLKHLKLYTKTRPHATAGRHTPIPMTEGASLCLNHHGLCQEWSAHKEGWKKYCDASDIHNDHESMKLAVQACPLSISLLGRKLWNDAEYVLELLQAKPTLLPLLPGEAFAEGPEWLREALVLLFNDEDFLVDQASDFILKIRDYVPLVDEFIHDYWIPSGGPLTLPVLDIIYPDNLVPRRIWESFVEHCSRRDYLVASFNHAATNDRDDMRWMSHMIYQRPSLFSTATAELQQRLRRQLQAYAPFHFLMGRLVEEEASSNRLRFDDFNFLIAEFLGSGRLREGMGSLND